MIKNYQECYEYLSAQFPEVGGCEFYKEIFPNNEVSGVKCQDFSHPSAIICIVMKINEFAGERCIVILGSEIILSL